jgi:hypothetical protein
LALGVWRTAQTSKQFKVATNVYSTAILALAFRYLRYGDFTGWSKTGFSTNYLLVHWEMFYDRTYWVLSDLKFKEDRHS